MKHPMLPQTNAGMCELSDEAKEHIKEKYRGVVGKGPNMEDINELPNTQKPKAKKKENS